MCGDIGSTVDFGKVDSIPRSESSAFDQLPGLAKLTHYQR